MKHLKMIGLALAVAAAFMAFAGSASAAPTLTSPTGTEYTGTLTATASGSVLFKATFANITCTGSTVSGNISTSNETHASGSITTFSFSGCSATTDLLKNADGTYGSLTINQKGEIFGSNSRFTFETAFTHCVFSTVTNTKVGAVTPSSSLGGKTAVMHINAFLPYSAESRSSQFICGSTLTWTVSSYTINNPDVVNLA